MGFFSFIEKKEHTPIKIITYLDIGVGNARSAVVQIKKGKPHVLYTILGAEKISKGKEDSNPFERALMSLREVLDETARVLKKGKGPSGIYAAEDIYCVLAAPYYLSHTSILVQKEKKPFTVSPHGIKNLLESGKQPIPKAHTGTILGNAPHILHEKIIDMSINGYHTTTPYGKEAEILEVAVFKSEIAEELYRGIEKVVKEHTAAPLAIEPFSLAAFVTLRNRIHNKDDFIFVTIGSEVSEVSLVRDGILLETISFPFGKFSLGREVASKLNLSPDEALSRISLLHDQKLNVAESAKLSPIVEGVQAEWFSYLEKALVGMAEETSLPSDVFVIVDTELKDIFGNIVASEGFASQTLVPNGFTVQTVDTALLADCCSFGLNIRFDTLLAVSASFAGAARETLPIIYPQK
jgi:hypothetical protein